MEVGMLEGAVILRPRDNMMLDRAGGTPNLIGAGFEEDDTWWEN